MEYHPVAALGKLVELQYDSPYYQWQLHLEDFAKSGAGLSGLEAPQNCHPHGLFVAEVGGSKVFCSLCCGYYSGKSGPQQMLILSRTVFASLRWRQKKV